MNEALEGLSEIERKTYNFIKRTGETQPKNMPDRKMIGAISTLRAKGLVTIVKRYTSSFRKRKKKFVRVTQAV